MKNLIVTVNGVAYNVTVEEGTGAPVAAAAPAAAPAALFFHLDIYYKAHPCWSAS